MPILKIDQGLADEANGVQLMKPIQGLPSLLSADQSDEEFTATLQQSVDEIYAASVAGGRWIGSALRVTF